MKLKICDVCDSKHDEDESLIEMLIPGDYLDNMDGEVMHADVCSWDCVRIIALGALGEDTAEDAPDEHEAVPPRKVKMAKTSDLDEKQLAELSETVTGVKRRY